MKQFMLFLFLLFIATVTYGQTRIAHSQKDSIALDRTWKKFKTAFLNKDVKTLKLLSLKTIKCDFYQNNTSDQSPYISVNTFLTDVFHGFPNTKLRRAVLTKKSNFSFEKISNLDLPENIKPQKVKSIMICEVWYVVWEPNEIAKGHEGASEGFQFVKIDNQFKFYGLTSIP